MFLSEEWKIYLAIEKILNIWKMLLTGIFLFVFVSAMAKAPLLTAKEISSPPPRIIRTCCSFGFDLSYVGVPFAKRTDIITVSDLGKHHYLGSENENNGIVYSKRGGFIDIGHLRDCADWTAYIYSLILRYQASQTDSVIILGTEGGIKTLILELPSKIDSLVAYQLSGKIAYELSLWHEIATWFGVSYIPMVPERYSSFSPEDLYSNLLGVELGIRALKSNLEYNEAMTEIIANMLDSLEAVPSTEETYLAMENVQNIWWTSEKKIPNKKILIKRYTDSDCYLIPWLIPNEESTQLTYNLNKPENYLSELYELKIKLNYKFPFNQIFPKHKNRIITQKDFGKMMIYVNNEISDLDQKIEKQIERKQIRKDSKIKSRL